MISAICRECGKFAGPIDRRMSSCRNCGRVSDSQILWWKLGHEKSDRIGIVHEFRIDGREIITPNQTEESFYDAVRCGENSRVIFHFGRTISEILERDVTYIMAGGSWYKYPQMKGSGR